VEKKKPVANRQVAQCALHSGRRVGIFSLVYHSGGMDSPVERETLFFTAGCTNDDPKRLKVLEELMATEQHYIRDLSVLIRGYIVPLRNSQILTENDVEQLCFNIEAIEVMHIDIFSNLSRIVEQHKTDSARPLSYYVAEYFNNLSEKLKLYSTYSR
jgi:RhoGEF domain